MTQYAVEIDLQNRNTSHTQVIELVGADKTVLDVGCWTGDVGLVLKEQGCRVWGVEVDSDAAAVAREHLEDVLVADLDATLLSDHFEEGKFDVVVFADVLEHLKDPDGVLRDAVSLLAPGGRVVISVPNVTHGSIRLALLQGRWNYSETGLLDRTHIQFYAREGLVELVQGAGLLIDDLRATLADPLATEVAVDAGRLPVPVVDWVRHQPDALVYQFQLSARVGTEADDGRAVQLLVPAEPEENIRVVDAHTERAEADLADRRRVLTVRDHMIGLEAAATAAEAKSERQGARNRHLRQQVKQKSARLRKLRQRIRSLERGVAQTQNVQQTGLARTVVRRVRKLR